MSTTLVLFGILFVLVRLAVLVHPDGAGWAAQRDEALTGNVALGLESGFGFAPPLYQTKPFAAGTLYEGLLSVPFRKIFGPNLFALKLAAVAWNVAAMLLWIALAWRYFGRAAALAVGTLHVLAPPFYALMTVTAWGNHCESSLFAAAMLLFLLPAVMFRGPGRGVLFAALAGLGAGVGVYMSYTSLLYVAFGLVVIFLCAGKRGAARILPAFAAAGVIGALPLLWSVRHYGLSALLKIDTYTGYAQGAMVSSRTLFLESGFGLALKKFVLFWTRDLWDATLLLKDQGFVSGVATFTALAVLFTAHFVWNRRDTLRAMLREPLAHRSREEQNEIFQVALLTYPILFSVLYAASGFRVVPADDPTPGLYVNYRYFVPVFPFLFLLFGAGVQDIWERARPDRMFRAVAMALALLGAFGLARYYLRLDDRRPAAYFTAWQYRGDDVSHLMNRLAAQLPRDNDPYAEKVARILHLRPSDRVFFFEFMGRAGVHAFADGLILARDITPDVRPALYRGLGLGLAERAFKPENLADPAAFVRARFDETDPVPGAYLGEFLEGVGWGMSLSSQEGPMPLVRAMDAWDISRPNWEKSLRKGFGRGLGARMQIEAEFGEPEDVIYDEGLGAQLRRNAEIYGVGFDVAAESILMWDNPRRTALVRGFSSEGREVFSE